MAAVTTSDGARLNYVDGPAVVLIAGSHSPLEPWELQRRALRAADLDRPDLVNDAILRFLR
jgi:tRNA G37 N-methylase TrmD